MRAAVLAIALALTGCSGEKQDDAGLAVIDMAGRDLALASLLPKAQSLLPFERTVAELYPVDADYICLYAAGEGPQDGMPVPQLGIVADLRDGTPKRADDVWFIALFRMNGSGVIIKQPRGMHPVASRCAPVRDARLTFEGNAEQVPGILDPILVTLKVRGE